MKSQKLRSACPQVPADLSKCLIPGNVCNVRKPELPKGRPADRCTVNITYNSATGHHRVAYHCFNSLNTQHRYQ